MSDREYSKVRFEYDIWIDEGVSPWGSQIRIRTGSTHSWIWTGVNYLDDRGFFSSAVGSNDTNIHPYLGQYNGSQNNCIIPRQTWYTVHDIIDVDANTHIWNIIIGSNTYTYTLPYVSDYISFNIGNGDDHRTNYMGSMHFKIKNIKCYAIFHDDSEDLIFQETFDSNSLDLNMWKFFPNKSGVDNPIVSNNCLELSANCKGSINSLYSVLTNGTAYLTTYGPIPYQNKSSYLYCFSGKTPVNYPSFPYTNLQDLLDNCEPYSAEGTINIPSNYSFVNIYMIGGGGAGGIHCVENTNCGAGGGGSGYYKEYLGIPVNNKSIKVHVGAGGTRKWRERGVLEGNYKGNDGEESYVIIDDVKYAAAGGIGGGTGIFGCGGDGNIGGCAPACNCVPTNKLTNISTCIGTNQSSYKSSIHYWNIEKAKGASYIQQIKNEEYLLYGSYSCGLVLTDGKTDNFKICNYITNPSTYGDIYEHNFTFYWDGSGEVWITSPVNEPLHNGSILLTINDTIIMQETCSHSGYIYMIPFIDVDRINITHLCRSINDRTNLNTIVFKHQVYNTSINISELYVTSSSKNLYSIHMTGNQLESVHKTVVETFDIDIPKVPAISTTFGRNGIGEGGDGIVGYNIHDTQYNFMGSRGGSGCVIIELCELIQDPVADFDIYPTVCIQGTEVDFINTSQYYDSCKWDLKDNTTATTVHASHVYNIPGEYQITLTVYKGTKSSSITKTLLIDIDHVIADFDIILDNEKYAPRTISFINTSIGGVAPFTYEWYYKLNDGSWIFIDNTRDISDYLFKRVGIYDIKMVIYNTWSTDTKIVEDAFEIIEPFVSCNFTSDFNNLADNPAPLIVTFYPVTEGLVDTYMWDFGDGTIITVHKNKYDPDKSITHMYDPGDINTTRYYNVSLTVSNSMNSDFVNKIDYIYVTPLMPKPMFIVNEPSRGIRPHNVTFHNMSQYSESYMWDFGDGVTSYDEFPSHTYTEMGEYTVSLTAYNYGKSRTPLYKRSITYTLPKAVIVTGEQLHVLISSK